MGTNFYVKTGKMKKVICNYGCEHEIEEELHIGKNSYGWKFNLHIIPDMGINELEDWRPILKSGKIYDEYDRPVSYEEMIDFIINKKPMEYHGCTDYLCTCDPEDGLNYCIKNEIGKESISYVLNAGEFS